MRVTRISIADLWSYGGQTVLSDLGRVNVIIGKNNAGKSNLLRAMKWARETALLSEEELARYEVKPNWVHNSGVSMIRQSPGIECVFNLTIRDWPSQLIPEWMARLQSLGDEERLNAVFTISLRGESPRISQQLTWEDDQKATELLTANATKSEVVVEQLLPLAKKMVTSKVIVLDGWRQLSDRVKAEQNYVEFIHQLRRSPDAAQRDSELYRNIRVFFQDLTGFANIDIYPRDEDDFNITIGDGTLPLSQYGDGIRHLLMVAIQAAMDPGGVFLVEEPETHLHPHFQRHLLSFLTARLNSQVFVTTHSPVFLDSHKADRIVRVVNESSSKVEVVEAPHDYYEALDDIGARASDILQANVVIWVEGPSDRTLIRHALGIVAPDLQEGLHFQVACYGGALRKFCGFGEGSDALVNLMRLGRHVAMICDRDGDSSDVKINTEKERLRNQCLEVKGFYWMTQGREIENYLNPSVLSRVYKGLLSVDDVSIRISENQRLDNVLQSLARRLKIKRSKWLNYAKHKPEIMAKIVKVITEIADLDYLDFRPRLESLAQFIRDRNTLNIAHRSF